jgi:VanZ family protein
MAGHRSSAVPLAWLFAALIVYASLYPFTGWQAARAPSLAFLSLPVPRWWTGFDLAANLLGYLPLGLLICLAWLRNGGRPVRGVVMAVAVGAGLSGSMEWLQNFLPQRVPSNVDLLLNTAGAAVGAGIGLLAHWLGAVALWQSVRGRWFVERSAGGLALLTLWPVGLLFPAPVVLGLGPVLGRVQDALSGLLAGTALEASNAVTALVEAPPLATLSPGAEMVAVTLGLMAPCLIGFTITPPGWRRLVLVLSVATLGFTATTLSTALNFGPEHALAWSTAPASAAFALGMLLCALLVGVPARLSAGLGLVALTALVVLLAPVTGDPYYAQSLQSWEQGEFIRFHGAAQWVGWLWPYAALVYLLMRVGAKW